MTIHDLDPNQRRSLPVPAFMVLPEPVRTRYQRVIDAINRYVLSGLLVFMILVIGYVSVLAFAPVRTFEIAGNPKAIPLINPGPRVAGQAQLARGDVIETEFSYCKYIDTSAKVIASLRYPDGSSYTYPPSETKAEVGCRTAMSRSRTVPDTAPVGCDVVLKLSYRYWINSLQGERGPDFQTEPFCVTAGGA